MPCVSRYSQFSSTIWYEPKDWPYTTKQIFNSTFKKLGTFSSTTNWEKVFEMGDKINRELKLSEKEIMDEIVDFRKKSKR